LPGGKTSALNMAVDFAGKLNGEIEKVNLISFRLEKKPAFPGGRERESGTPAKPGWPAAMTFPAKYIQKPL